MLIRLIEQEPWRNYSMSVELGIEWSASTSILQWKLALLANTLKGDEKIFDLLSTYATRMLHGDNIQKRITKILSDSS